MRPAPCTRWGRNGQWSRADTCKGRPAAPIYCSTATTFTSSMHSGWTPPTTTARATHWPPRRPARWRTVTRCWTRSRSPKAGSPNVSAPPIPPDTAMARCLRCLGCTRDAPATMQSASDEEERRHMNSSLQQIAGVAHEPDGTPAGVVVLTHGAGGNSESPLLQRLCDEWARRGWLAVRYNLPYRRRRPKGPPSGSAGTDRAGIVEALTLCRGLADGPLIAGGHSYGGRMTSMVVAAKEAHVDVLTLFSYPVHPPGKPERARTEHLPDIDVPTVFTHGTSDPFGTPDEVRGAAALIPAPTQIVEIAGAGHDLGSKTLDVPGLAVAAALRLLGRG